MELKPETYKGITIRIVRNKPDKWGAVLYEYTHALMDGWSSVPYGGVKSDAVAYAVDSIDTAIRKRNR